MHNICVFTSICEEDREHFDRYLNEIDRLKMMFVIHFDRCRDSTKWLFGLHPRCLGYTMQDDPSREFTEQDKQGIFDLIAADRSFKWALAWDVDETFEREAPRKMRLLAERGAANITTRWLNLWDDARHIRIDPPYDTGYRVKFYNLKYEGWKFQHPIVNGAKIDGQESIHNSDLVCLHWGMMTERLRILHKQRWDRIYSTALRGDPNPYGFWKDALDPTKPAKVTTHAYF